MYGWFFRHLPGPTWFKVIEAAALIALIVWALFTWGFPWINEYVTPESTLTQS